jgi:hypothetical protein
MFMVGRMLLRIETVGRRWLSEPEPYTGFSAVAEEEEEEEVVVVIVVVVAVVVVFKYTKGEFYILFYMALKRGLSTYQIT